MSLFQCDKCGCLENTALTECYHCSYLMNHSMRDKNTHLNTRMALQSYKTILGLKEDESFGHYCSACCPTWFTDSGNYGVGPNLNPEPGEGLWHGEFERFYLPKGQFETDPNGNLWHKKTRDQDIKKYRLPKEDGT